MSDALPEQGLHVTRQDGQPALERALAMAVDYRGDVTIEHAQGSSIECFVFDCSDGDVRYMTASGTRERIACDDVDGIRFSGKDTAAGISFERWIDRYVKRTLAGEDASLHGDDA